jgi:hypothetical protein
MKFFWMHNSPFSASFIFVPIRKGYNWCRHTYIPSYFLSDLLMASSVYSKYPPIPFSRVIKHITCHFCHWDYSSCSWTFDTNIPLFCNCSNPLACLHYLPGHS